MARIHEKSLTVIENDMLLSAEFKTVSMVSKLFALFTTNRAR